MLQYQRLAVASKRRLPSSVQTYEPSPLTIVSSRPRTDGMCACPCQKAVSAVSGASSFDLGMTPDFIKSLDRVQCGVRLGRVLPSSAQEARTHLKTPTETIASPASSTEDDPSRVEPVVSS